VGVVVVVIIIGSVELNKIRYFQEMPWWLKMPVVQRTALAAAVIIWQQKG
jgi:hypothetical protein